MNYSQFLTILLVNKEKTFSFKYARSVPLYIAHSVDEGLVNFRTDRISWPARLESAVIPCRPLVFIIFKISSKMKIKTKEKIQLNHLVQCAWSLNSKMTNRLQILLIWENSVHHEISIKVNLDFRQMSALCFQGVAENSSQEWMIALPW